MELKILFVIMFRIVICTDSSNAIIFRIPPSIRSFDNMLISGIMAIALYSVAEIPSAVTILIILFLRIVLELLSSILCDGIAMEI